jgi:hypothetical protein
MESALSLVSGQRVFAHKCSYEFSAKLKIVCPECREPVYFKRLGAPHKTPFFAHYKGNEADSKCLLRAYGNIFGNVSKHLKGLSRGQFVDKFQKSFWQDICEAFGSQSKDLMQFIVASNFENLDQYHYEFFLESIKNSAPYTRILTRVPANFDKTEFEESISDICLFLDSKYGYWVGNLIYQTAYFIAVTLHNDALHPKIGKGFYKLRNLNCIFPIDPGRLSKTARYAHEILPEKHPRNLAIYKIASSLTSYLVFRWKYADLVPKLISKKIQPKESAFVSPLPELVAVSPHQKPTNLSATAEPTIESSHRYSRFLLEPWHCTFCDKSSEYRNWTTSSIGPAWRGCPSCGAHKQIS